MQKIWNKNNKNYMTSFMAISYATCRLYIAGKGESIFLKKKKIDLLYFKNERIRALQYLALYMYNINLKFFKWK